MISKCPADMEALVNIYASDLPMLRKLVDEADAPLTRGFAGAVLQACALMREVDLAIEVFEKVSEADAAALRAVTEEASQCISHAPAFNPNPVPFVLQQEFEAVPSCTDGASGRSISAPAILSATPQSSTVSTPDSVARPLILDSCATTLLDASGAAVNWPQSSFGDTADDEFAFVSVPIDCARVFHCATPDSLSGECGPSSPSLSSHEMHSAKQWDGLSSTDSGSSEGKADYEIISSGASIAPERLVVRNTFIDVESEEKVPLTWNSCPPVIMKEEFRTKYPEMEAAHIRGDCRPCAYFLSKGDGCREGGRCHFCHLCPVGALKKKKKQKVKDLKKRDYLAKMEAKREAAAQSC